MPERVSDGQDSDKQVPHETNRVTESRRIPFAFTDACLLLGFPYIIPLAKQPLYLQDLGCFAFLLLRLQPEQKQISEQSLPQTVPEETALWKLFLLCYNKIKTDEPLFGTKTQKRGDFMIDQMIMNARKPSEDEYGQKMLERMNTRHDAMALWALDHLQVSGEQTALDIGCGGGKNISNLLNLLPEAKVFGIDYSSASVAKSREVNKDALQNGRADIQIGTAEKLPYEDASMDLVTAFETVYYWPEIETCFQGIFRALKPGGRFLVCNEDNSAEGKEELQRALEMNFYSAKDLEAMMRAAGFSEIMTDSHENGNWIVAVGKKD